MVKTLYLQISGRPLPPLQAGDVVLLLADALLQSPPSDAEVFVLADDLCLLGLPAPAGVRVIDHRAWVDLVAQLDRCVSW